MTQSPLNLASATSNDPDAGIKEPDAPVTRATFLHALDRMAGSFEGHLKKYYEMLLEADLKLWVQGGLLKDFCTGTLKAPVTVEEYETRQKHHLELFWEAQAAAEKAARSQ